MMRKTNSGLIITAVFVVLIGTGSVWADLTDGLVAHWKFDEGSGTIAHDSAGSNDGTLVNGPVWTTGKIDGALDFDGVNDYINCGDILDNEIRNAFTIGVWIKLGEGALQKTFNYVLWKGDDRPGIRVHSDGKVAFLLWTGGLGCSFKSTHVLEEGKWYYVSYVFNGSEFIGYINAEYAGAAPDIGYSPGGDLRIAGETDSNRYFKGLLDDIRIYNRALSAEEVEELYELEAAKLVGLEITGSDEVAENSQAQYKAIAHYDNDSTADITSSVNWSVEPNNLAGISAGLLTTQSINMPEEDITIFAQCTQDSNSFDAQKDVSIFAVCPYGTALEFDGDGDYVDIPYDSSLDIDASDGITVSAWIKVRAYPSPGGIDGRPIFGLFYETDSKNYLGITRAVDGSRIFWDQWPPPGGLKSIKPDLDVWYHVVAVQDATYRAIYINGILDSSDNNPETYLGNTPDTIAIGGWPYPNYYFDGTIDDVRIYDKALTTEEIQANMHRKLTGDEDGLVGCWNFDESAGQIAYDLSPYGNNGRLGSTPNPDSSDPKWTDSVPPVGICTQLELIERNLSGALDIKLGVSEKLEEAMAKEHAAKRLLREWFKSRDYGDLTRRDIIKAIVKTIRAFFSERIAKRLLNRSIDSLEDALSSLGWEPQPEPEPNLVAHWKFDEGTGYIAYDSAGNNHGTLVNNPSWTTGQVGSYALDCDGDGDYIEVPDADSLTPPNKLTISFWIYNRGGQPAAINKYASCPNESNSPGNSEAYYIVISSNNDKVLFRVFSEAFTFDDIWSNNTVPLNQWHHVVGTFDQGQAAIYIDGQLDNSMTMSVPSIMNDAHSLTIGGVWSYCGPDQFVSQLNGSIDDVRIYDKALTTEEVDQLYHSGL